MNRVPQLLILLIGISIRLHSQVNVELEKGDKAFDNLSFDEALFFYEVANEQQPNDPGITRRIANLYRRIGQMTISAEWYKKTLDLDSTNATDKLYYAESLKSLGQYDEAIEWYERYARANPADTRAISHLRDREYYKDLFADTLRYDMKRLKINNADPVIGITPFGSGKYLLAAINANQANNESGKNEYLQYLDIYEVTLNATDELENPVRLSKSVNSKYHDGPACFSPGDQSLYITRNNMRNGKPVLDKNGTVNLKIYSSQYTSNSWTPAEELRFNDDAFSYGHPSLSPDGQEMYIVSNKPGGLGGTDIYAARKTPTGWSDPVNLGPQVNTEGNEMFPVITPEGRLFFASDGHAGLGGMDLFVSDFSGNGWQLPSNLGAPINSSSDDFSLLYNKELDKGFFCSNRSGRGNDDIFFYSHRKLEKTILAGTIKVNAPGVVLSGERIRIKTTNTNMTTEQRLDERENFRITADPGDIIEVYMTNEEFFDTNTPVFQTTISNPILDPYINLGEHIVNLKKIPLKTGALSQFEPESIVSSMAGLGEVPLPDVKDNMRNTRNNELLDPQAAEEGSTTRKDQSTLIITNAQGSVNAEAARLYRENIAFGEQMLRNRKFEDAKSYYTEALKYQAGDAFARARIQEIDNIFIEFASQPAPTAEKGGKPRLDFESTPAVIDLERLKFNNILFDYNKSFIREEERDNLEQVIQILKANPETMILIKAYCDSRGSQAYNQSLSMSRAMAVQGFIMQGGITRNRIQTEWYGEQRPLNDCEDGIPCSEDQYEVNRRAELKIVARK